MNNVKSLIAVDIGNSSTKVGGFAIPSPPQLVLAEPTWVANFATLDGPGDALLARLPGSPTTWQIVSVQRAGTKRLTQWIAEHRPRDTVRELTHADLPIRPRVDFPERVGLDRLAAGVAANRLRENNRPAIVIDAGTAMTVDAISPSGDFEGGAILLGFRMSAQALASATDALPLVVVDGFDKTPPPIGKSTEAAIRSGLFWGAVGAAREIIAQAGKEWGQPPQVFVTGGDLERLQPLLGNDAKFVPHMALRGAAIS
jgi:type III pantothenate kinase